MFFHHRFIPGLAINSYMVGDEKTKECAIIDPTRDVDEYVEIARREGLYIRHVLETHVHADFVSGSVELKNRIGDDLTIHCSGLGGQEWIPPYADHVVANKEKITMGSVLLEALHTPGHTPEHLSWLLYDLTRSDYTPWLMFTGDFLFVGDVGRPDLLGKDEQKELAHQLYQSVFRILPDYASFTEIFPAHGAGSLCGKAIGSRNSSTLGYEHAYNPSLQPAPEDEWTKTLLKGMPIAPPYFRRMKEVNAEGPKVIGSELPGRERFTAKEVYDRVCEHCLVVDVRPKEAFAAAHIPGAINIPHGHNLPTWAGWVLPYDRPTLIVPSEASVMPDVVTHLLRVGFDDVRGFLEGGMMAWEEAGYPLSHLDTMSVQSLHDNLMSGNGPFVLDVRTEGEWNNGRIEGAHHIHGGLLKDRFEEVPRDRPVAVICGSGYRASIAASFLKREGYEEVANVLGGMTAWVAADLPMSK